MAVPVPARRPGPLVWVLANLVVLALLAIDVRASRDGIVGNGAYWGRDFVNLWTAGRLVLADRTDILYDLASYGRFQRALFGPIADHNFSYSPVNLLLAAPFGLLPYGVAFALWTAAGAAFFYRAAAPFWPKAAGPAWLALLMPAATLNIWAGHYGFLIGGLFLTGFRLLDHRPRLAGLCFGLMVLKPHLALLAPLVLLLRRRWPALGAAAVTVGVLVGASILLFGADLWRVFLVETSGRQLSMVADRSSFFRLLSPTIASGAMQAGLGWTAAIWIQAAIGLAAVTALAMITLRPGASDRLALPAVTATFLALPYAFSYDMTVVMLGSVALAASARPSDRAFGFAGLFAPQAGFATLLLLNLPLAPILLAIFGAGQLRVALRAGRLSESPASA